MALIRFNKPYGILSQFTDTGTPEARATLSEFITMPGVYPAGRLDRDSEGLLLLTDDGALQAQIADPRFKLPKTYLVQVEGLPDAAAIARLRGGVTLKDGPTRPAKAELIDPPALWPRDPPVRYRKTVPDSWLRLTITRRAQPSGAPDDGGGGAPDFAAGALEHRRMDAGRSAAGRMAGGFTLGPIAEQRGEFVHPDQLPHPAGEVGITRQHRARGGFVCGLHDQQRADDQAVGAFQRADDHEMIGIGVDEIEMRRAVDRAQAAAVFAVAAMEAEHAHWNNPPVGYAG